MSTSPKKVEAKQKAAASRKLLFERYQRQYSFSNHHQQQPKTALLPQVDENDDSTFACIHPSSPCRNLHNVPIADWSSGCLHEDDTIASSGPDEAARRLSPAARARERQLALQQHTFTQNYQPQRLALLVVDLQNDFLDEAGVLGPSDMTVQRTLLLTRIRELTQQTLQLGGVVYFIQSMYFGSRDGGGGCCTMGTTGSDWHPEAAAMIELLSRHSRVHRMTKQWYSAFLETSLHAQLQQQHVTHILVAGVSTPQSVAATVRSANHLGYITTLTDATAQPDAAQQPVSYFSLAPFCHGVLAPSVPIPGQIYTLGTNELDDEKKEDERDQRKISLTNNSNARPERLIFDGCVRLSGIGAGDSMLLPEVFEAEKADALLSVIVKVVGAKHKLHYEWTDDKASTWTAIFRSIQTHIEKLTNQGMDWGRVVLMKPPTESQDEKSVITNASSSTEGTMNLGSPRKKHALSAPSERVITNSLTPAAYELRDVYNQCYLPSDKVTRRPNYVAVVALGEGRIIEFEPKNIDEIKYAPQHIYCHHNSLLLIGPRTLQNYNHIIKTRKNRSNPSPRVHISLGGLSRSQSATVPAPESTKVASDVEKKPILPPVEIVAVDFSAMLRDNRLRKMISLIFFFGFLLGYFRATALSEATCKAA